jgi:hypothetical protein
MVRTICLALLFTTVVCVSGCAQSKPLTRSRAKDIIERSSSFQETNPFLPPIRLKFPNTDHGCRTYTKEILLGVDEGYWRPAKSPTGEEYVELTDKGKKYFSRIFWGPSLTATGCFAEPSVKLHKRITQVTGIAGEGSEREVEFEWVVEMDALPGDLRQLFQNPLPQKETRVLVLYDDGWRAQ